MLKGYVVNHNAVSEQKYEDLKRALGLLENVFGQNLIMAEQQAKELFAVVRDYTYALDTLDAYDYQNLEISDVTLHEKFRATYASAMEAIQSLKNRSRKIRLFGYIMTSPRRPANKATTTHHKEKLHNRQTVIITIRGKKPYNITLSQFFPQFSFAK